MLNELLAELRELAEGEVPAGPVLYLGAPIRLKGRRKKKRRDELDELRELKPKPGPQVGQKGFPAKLATRGVSEMNVITRGLKYKAVELDKKSEVLKQTGGVTMRQQAWLDRHVLHPVTRINSQLDAINAKIKKTFFEGRESLGDLLAELRESTEQ